MVGSNLKNVKHSMFCKSVFDYLELQTLADMKLSRIWLYSGPLVRLNEAGPAAYNAKRLNHGSSCNMTSSGKSTCQPIKHIRTHSPCEDKDEIVPVMMNPNLTQKTLTNKPNACNNHLILLLV